MSAEPVSRERLSDSIAALARWTKHAGTPEELESLRFVEQELRSYGYATELLLHDAYVSLPGRARLLADGAEVPCITHSFSRATDGIEGRFPVVDGLAMPGALLPGVEAQVHVSPDEQRHEMCISPVWGSPDDRDVARLPQAVVVTVAHADGPRVRAASTLRIEAEVDTGWRPTPILVAELVRPDEPFVLFSGHHDAWYVGAMDNGGANATMLEVARLCAARRGEWRRGLRLAFWSGHSQGRYSSSAWYADDRWEELEQRCVAHVNVDSTGGRGNLLVDETTASGELRALAREAIAEHAGQEFRGLRMHRAGDQSFWGIGVSSIFGNMGQHPPEERIAFGTGWWWHTPDDTLDKLDLDVLERDTSIYRHVVWRLLTDAVPPLDYAETARDVAAAVAERAGDLDVSVCLDRAASIAERAERFAAAEHADPAAAWECLRRVGRALVPVDYTAGDRFGHDPALGQPAVPSFARGAGEGDPRFERTRLVRARNRVAVALRDALAAYDAYLGA